MRGIVGTTTVGALAALALSLTGGAPERGGRAPDVDDLRAVGLTADGQLVRFRADEPDDTRRVGPVTGLVGDARLVGIDYRVQDGELYGVGDRGGVYTLDESRAAATKVRQLSVPLEGAAFGVDFNPAANALRIVSDTGQNLRQPFATADAPTAVDTPLTNPAAPPATGTVAATGVTAAGYTNNDLDAGTATTLVDLDTALDRLALQSPANAGALAPTGGLPADVGADAGLDVRTTLDRAGRAVANQALATVEVGGTRHLWAIDLLSGAATDLGAFDAPVTDLALELDR
jgi:hypothetical protein